jgi:hypothetical protein
MSINDTIGSLANATITVRRTVRGPIVNGRATPGASTTFEVSAVAQPAKPSRRVTSGIELRATHEGQSNVAMYELTTDVEIHNGTDTHEPDVIVGFLGADWSVVRVESWSFDGAEHWRSTISRQT